LEKDADGRPRKVTGKKETEMYQKAKDEVLHQVLELIVKEMNGLYEDGIELSCADGFIRDGRPLLAGWIADYLEYGKLLQIRQDGCAVCEIAKAQLGDNVTASDRNETEAMQHVYALHSATKTYEAAKLQRIAAKTLSFRGVTKYRQDLRKKEIDAKKTMDTLTDYFTDRQL